jgi:hypothetical protein
MATDAVVLDSKAALQAKMGRRAKLAHGLGADVARRDLFGSGPFPGIQQGRQLGAPARIN